MFSKSKKSNKKIIETKLNLFTLATEINDEISSNRQNLEKNEILKSQIKEIKLLLSKYSKSKNITKEEIKNDFNEIINKLKIKKLEIEIKNTKIEEKNKNLILKIQKNFLNLNNEINLLNESNFLLENSLKEKNFLIDLLKNNLKIFKENFFFREEKQDNFIENKNEVENFFFIYNLNVEKFLYYKCKKFNFFYNKNNQKLKTKLNLINSINYLKNKKILSSNSNNKHQNLTIKKIFKNSNSFEKNFLNDENIFFNEKNEKTTSEKKNLFQNFSEIFLEQNNFIEDSDEEFSFPNKIKTISTKYKNIPILNLKQIEFNKYRNQKEIDLYSLQRRINSDGIEEQIKLSKKNIKKIKKHIEKNQIRISNFKNVFNHYKLRYRNYSFEFNNNYNKIYFLNKNQNINNNNYNFFFDIEYKKINKSF